MFFFFKIFKKLENLFFEKPKDYLLRTRFGTTVKKIPWLKNFYRAEHNFSNWLYYKLKPKGITLINVRGNKMYVNTDDVGVVRVTLIQGVWEKYETELFKKLVKEGMVVVDIGAYFGYYSLLGAKLVGKYGTVYAFEPEPANYKLLCKSIELNGYTNIVVPIQKAISNKCGKIKLWVDRFNLGSASISEVNTLPALFRNLSKKVSIEVETTTLDEFFKNTVENNKVDFIKIDTQGAEGFIIDGAEKILKSNNSLKIFMEFWPGGLRNLGTNPLGLLLKLQKYGFNIKIINERKQILESIEPIGFMKKVRPKEEFNLLLEKSE
jgi:FkbM family methyltransferase